MVRIPSAFYFLSFRFRVHTIKLTVSLYSRYLRRN